MHPAKNTTKLFRFQPHASRICTRMSVTYACCICMHAPLPKRECNEYSCSKACASTYVSRCTASCNIVTKVPARRFDRGPVQEGAANPIPCHRPTIQLERQILDIGLLEARSLSFWGHQRRPGSHLASKGLLNKGLVSLRTISSSAIYDILL